MECPECGGNSKTLDTRKYEGNVYRSRECKCCGFRFDTMESLVPYTRDHQFVMSKKKYYKDLYAKRKAEGYYPMSERLFYKRLYESRAKKSCNG